MSLPDPSRSKLCDFPAISRPRALAVVHGLLGAPDPGQLRLRGAGIERSRPLAVSRLRISMGVARGALDEALDD